MRACAGGGGGGGLVVVGGSWMETASGQAGKI